VVHHLKCLATSDVVEGESSEEKSSVDADPLFLSVGVLDSAMNPVLFRYLMVGTTADRPRSNRWCRPAIGRRDSPRTARGLEPPSPRRLEPSPERLWPDGHEPTLR
jgi:hypothetical protein